MTKRCECCGGKHELLSCPWAIRYNGPDVIEEQPARQPSCVLVWSADRRAIETLVAEWKWAHELIEPMVPGDLWGVRLSETPGGLDGKLAEYEVINGRLVGLESWDAVFERLL